MEASSAELQQERKIDNQVNVEASQIIHLDPGVPPNGAQYEYLDHPADIILHSWGEDLESSLCNIALCMF